MVGTISYFIEISGSIYWTHEHVVDICSRSTAKHPHLSHYSSPVSDACYGGDMLAIAAMNANRNSAPFARARTVAIISSSLT